MNSISRVYFNPLITSIIIVVLMLLSCNKTSKINESEKSSVSMAFKVDLVLQKMSLAEKVGQLNMPHGKPTTFTNFKDA